MLESFSISSMARVAVVFAKKKLKNRGLISKNPFYNST